MSTLTQGTVSKNNENVPVKEPFRFQGKMTSQVRSGDRRTLKPLQLTTDGSVVGEERKPTKKLIQPKILASCSPIRVYKDKKKWMEMGVQTDRPRLLEGGTQTEAPQSTKTASGSSDLHNDSGLEDAEAYDLMVKEPIPETYWRELAEERRHSLAEALSENEMLHQSMEELKEENLNLSQLAGQAEYLASVLNNIMVEDKEETSGEDKEEKEVKPEEVKTTSTAVSEGEEAKPGESSGE